MKLRKRPLHWLKRRIRRRIRRAKRVERKEKTKQKARVKVKREVRVPKEPRVEVRQIKVVEMMEVMMVMTRVESPKKVPYIDDVLEDPLVYASLMAMLDELSETVMENLE